jgi:hypothetical protein
VSAPSAAHGRRAPRCPLSALAVAALMAVAGTLGAPAIGAAQADASAGAVITGLSNQRTLSRWAYPVSAAIVRARPSTTSRTVGRLRFLTTDDQAELYLMLASARLPSGQMWIQLELPGRPNGQTGWVAQEALGPPHVVRGYLLVDRRRLRTTLFRAGSAVFSAPVGVGKPSTITPPGRFYVLEKLTTLADPLFGPYAIGTSAYAPTLSEWPGGGVVGIHGTDEPQLIPGRPSHGCVRMRDGDITRLWQMIALGTPILIT